MVGVPVVGAAALLLFAAWALPLWRVPSAVVVDTAGNMRVRMRWIRGREREDNDVPQRVPIVTRLPDGTELPGLCLAPQPGRSTVDSWEGVAQVERVLGTWYAIRITHMSIIDSDFATGANGVTVSVQDDAAVSYGFHAPWKQR